MQSTANSYRGNRHRSTPDLAHWHAPWTPEPALEPALPIVDPHHHLYGTRAELYYYLRDDFEQDILASGHNLVGTVWVEAYYSGWRTSGPEELRSLGEVENIVRATATPLRSAHGPCRVGAGLVSNVDLTLGDRAAEVLDLHVNAAQGRLSGVRHHASYDAGAIGRFMTPTQPQLLADPAFRRGVACLGRFGLSFDALVYHTQLDELAELADAFPNVAMVLNHVGIVIGVAEYAARRAEVLAQWRQSMRALSRRPNVFVKIGGMGMPVFGFGFEGQPRPAGSAALAQAWGPFIEFCIEAFGPARCMFESNFPVDKQSCGYGELWNAFKLASRSLSARERGQLFHGTACRVYRLPELAKACGAA